MKTGAFVPCSPGRPRALFCKRGHPLGAAALIRPNGAQSCRECQALRSAEWRKRDRERRKAQEYFWAGIH